MKNKSLSTTFLADGIEIRVIQQAKQEFISLTDIAKKFNARTEIVIQNWLRTRTTVELLSVWESLHNTDFNHIESDVIKMQAGLPAFTLSVGEWTSKTNAIGIHARAGRYGGTFAHADIALEFCSHLSPAFKLYVIKEFQRLQSDESKQLNQEWSVRRLIAKANHRIHTEAIRQHFIPKMAQQTTAEGLYFASESDLLNVAVFGTTAREWREQNPTAKGNLRDHATVEQLLVLANLESLNAHLLKIGLPQDERLKTLNKTAIEQIQILLSSSAVKTIGIETKKNP